MLKQSWSLGSTVPALCPKCNAEALHRSHTHTVLEEKRKHVSTKRPYRCHECDWRGWLEESQLRYSASVVKAKVVSNHEQDVEIPDIRLEGEDTLERRIATHREGASPSDAKKSSDAKNNSDAQKSSSGSEPGDKEERPSLADDAPTKEEDVELPKPPEFDEASGKPLTHKVNLAFHHHARHTAKRCPGCGEASLFRSRSRNMSENLKKRFTNKRLYRCHRCGWRGWLSKGF
ncbi:hypothetical protein KQI65_15495 [bacterium]|nr:hypothetical protein [bacterium]